MPIHHLYSQPVCPSYPTPFRAVSYQRSRCSCSARSVRVRAQPEPESWLRWYGNGNCLVCNAGLSIVFQPMPQLLALPRIGLNSFRLIISDILTFSERCGDFLRETSGGLELGHNDLGDALPH